MDAPISLLGFLTVSATASEEPDLTEGFRGALWGWPQVRAERALAKAYPTAPQDRSGQYRYPDTLWGYPCEVIPQYTDFRLTGILIRYYADGSFYNDDPEQFQRLETGLSEQLGKPAFREKYGKTKGTGGRCWRLSVWSRPDADLLLLLCRDEEYTPRVDLLYDCHTSSSDTSLTLLPTEEACVDKARRRIVKAVRHLRPDYLLEPQSTTPSRNNLPSPGDSIVVEAAPRTLSCEGPEYPKDAEQMGIEGTVWVQALLDKQGKVRDVRVAKSSGFNVGFEEAAVEAAYRCRYEPAKINGEPVAIWIAYPVHFRMRK